MEIRKKLLPQNERNIFNTSMILIVNFFILVHAIPWKIDAVKCNPREQDALLKFKSGLVDEGNFLESWSEGEDCCKWRGVTCHNKTGYVVELHLWNPCVLYDENCSPLYGKLDPSLFELKHLEFLDLSRHIGITGHIPREVGQLQNLRYLNLHGNQIGGTIPMEIGNLQNLEELDLSSNKFEGALPYSICRLKKLVDLSLDNNTLNGTLPDCLGSLVSLQSLNLADNQLRASLPSTLGQLSNITYILLQGNSLQGQVFKNHFENLTKLFHLDLSSNFLELKLPSGWVPPFPRLGVLHLDSCSVGPEYPSWLRGLKQLNSLSLSNTSIEGPLPQWFYETIPLSYLNLSKNGIQGELSRCISNYTPDSSSKIWDLSFNNFWGPIPLPNTSFQFLDLSFNQFTGPIPSRIMNSSIGLTLYSFHASGNNISGKIPSLMWDMQATSFKSLDLSNNQLIGELPLNIGNCTGLEALDLSGNHLHGQIPGSLGHLQSLKTLHLSDNNLSGMLPWELRNCTMLQTLDLGENLLTGRIPGWIGESLRDLRVLRLRSNLLSKEIPPDIMNLKSLHVIDISHNLLSGLIPLNVGNLTSMRRRQTKSELLLYGRMFNGPGTPAYFMERLEVQRNGQMYKYTRTLALVTSFDLSSNKLSGSIPAEITSLTGLIVLNLSDNCLSKGIPERIGNLVNLDTLDLSKNQLSGIIPSSLAAIPRLGHLNLSYNNLSGEIPKGFQLQTLDNPSIYYGNEGLCGFPLKNECSGKKNASNAIVSSRSVDRNDKVGIYASIVAGFIVGFWVFWGSLMFKRSFRALYFQFVDHVVGRACVVVSENFGQLRS